MEFRRRNEAIRIIGNSAPNLLDGELGDDSISGNDGNDTLYGSYGADAVIGGNGNVPRFRRRCHVSR